MSSPCGVDANITGFSDDLHGGPLSCARLKQFGGCDGGEHVAAIQEKCPATCGMCAPPGLPPPPALPRPLSPPGTSSPCGVDANVTGFSDDRLGGPLSCTTLKEFRGCDSGEHRATIREKCPATCGMCAPPGLPPPPTLPPPPPCIQSRSLRLNGQPCEELYQRCEEQYVGGVVSALCPITCGVCSGAPPPDQPPLSPPIPPLRPSPPGAPPQTPPPPWRPPPLPLTPPLPDLPPPPSVPPQLPEETSPFTFIATLVPVALVVGLCIFGWQLSQRGSKTRAWVVSVTAMVARRQNLIQFPDMSSVQEPQVEVRLAAGRSNAPLAPPHSYGAATLAAAALAAAAAVPTGPMAASSHGVAAPSLPGGKGLQRHGAAVTIQTASRGRSARRRLRRLVVAAATAAEQQELASRQTSKVHELQTMRTRETAENAQRAVLQRLISSVVGAWSTAHGPALRSLLAALDDPSLTQLLGACAEASVWLPPSSNAAAMRRAYLLAIKRVHPDKLGADSTLTERLTAGAIFDVLREAHERGVVAAAPAAAVEGAPSAAEAAAARSARKWRAEATSA